MAGVQAELQWWRDAAGYRLLEPAAPKPGGTLITGDPGRPLRIVRRGGASVPYSPLAEHPTLYAHFAESARNAPTLLSFVADFGPLTRSGLDNLEWGDDVEDLLKQADAMRGWLTAHAAGDALPSLGPAGIEFARLSAVLTAEPITRAPRLQLTVDSLLAGLWLQLAGALSEGVQLRQCEHCRRWFEVGAVRGARRLDARFCSDQHRIAFNNARRKPAADAAPPGEAGSSDEAA